MKAIGLEVVRILLIQQAVFPGSNYGVLLVDINFVYAETGRSSHCSGWLVHTLLIYMCVLETSVHILFDYYAKLFNSQMDGCGGAA